MRWGLRLRWVDYRSALIGAVMMATSAAALGQAGAGQKTPPATAPGKTEPGNTVPAQNPTDENADDKSGLIIEPPELPVTYPQGPYHIAFHVRGNYVPTLHWTLEKGALPPGITLDDNGTLRGEALRAGEFQFVVAFKDGSQPPQREQKEYIIKVVDALVIAWKVPAHVNVNRIEGSVDVTNATVDDMDLTYDVKAIAENGRATEIGYQHFLLTKGTIAMTLPLGDTLPDGAYLVRVDVTGEIARRNAIYKQALQTPAPLQIVTEP